jgi:hypothetical protein
MYHSGCCPKLHLRVYRCRCCCWSRLSLRLLLLLLLLLELLLHCCQCQDSISCMQHCRTAAVTTRHISSSTNSGINQPLGHYPRHCCQQREHPRHCSRRTIAATAAAVTAATAAVVSWRADVTHRPHCHAVFPNL